MKFKFAIAALTAAALAPPLVSAAEPVTLEEPAQLLAQSDGMTLSQAIESIRRRTGGKVLNAETRVQGGREVHYIKVLTDDGKVRTHRVNGRRR